MIDLRAHWRGRERYTVFATSCDAAALQEAWRGDPERPARLHIVALEPGLQPGFHRIPQSDPRLTLILIAAPLEEALVQLGAQPDAVFLDPVAGSDFVRPLARIVALGAQLFAGGLEA